MCIANWITGIAEWITDISHKHDDVIKWKHFPRYCPFVRGIHRSPVNSPHKAQWRGAVMFSSICARINGWVNNGEAGDLRRHPVHYDVIVMKCHSCFQKTDQFSTPGLCKESPGCSNSSWLVRLILQWRHNKRDGVSNHQPQPFIQVQFKENIKAPRHGPLWTEFTGDGWIPHTKGQ